MPSFKFDPNLVNARGDKLSDALGAPLLSLFGSASVGTDHLDQFQTLLDNWLTAGGPPKPIDQAQLYGAAQNLAPVEARASAGQGMAGLFGFGKTIGSIAPMSSGVPYSVAPAPKVSLNPLFNPAYGGVKFNPGGKR